eukprot:TRINITY_DN81625_c0_g1_i1.p1 TRINITY_DN81625_c0_g1~~TRINITY_DN81625_c0_g1_i1.p1  ORF type:complete len:146 (-),score=28.64 TRINITY_DN81625_c0_g1_i1:61-477(-)
MSRLDCLHCYPCLVAGAHLVHAVAPCCRLCSRKCSKELLGALVVAATAAVASLAGLVLQWCLQMMLGCSTSLLAEVAGAALIVRLGHASLSCAIQASTLDFQRSGLTLPCKRLYSSKTLALCDGLAFEEPVAKRLRKL